MSTKKNRGEDDGDDMKMRLVPHLVPEAEDFTFNLVIEQPLSADPFYRYCLGRMGRPETDEKKRYWTSFDFDDEFTIGSKKISLRLQVSSMDKGCQWSVTARAVEESVPEGLYTPTESVVRKDKWEPKATFGPLTYAFRDPESANDRSPFLFTFKEVVTALCAELFGNPGEHVQGFLLVTGGTGSGKSSIACGLGTHYLSELRRESSAQYLHLVTHEDPMEKRYFHAGVHYTPRQLFIDTHSLKESMNAALRQKPALFYAGELRDAEALRDCVDFAGTGHFVMATAHAGSLVESIEKIFKAVEAFDAGRRSVCVPKLFGVVHLALIPCCIPSDVIGEESIKRYGLVPTAYVRKPLGMQSLVADGLSSLLPYCPHTGDSSDGANAQLATLGRQYFVRRLCAMGVSIDSIKDDTARGVVEKWCDLRKWNGRVAGSDFVLGEMAQRLVDNAIEADLLGR